MGVQIGEPRDHLRVLARPQRAANDSAAVELVLAVEAVVRALLDEGAAGRLQLAQLLVRHASSGRTTAAQSPCRLV